MAKLLVAVSPGVSSHVFLARKLSAAITHTPEHIALICEKGSPAVAATMAVAKSVPVTTFDIKSVAKDGVRALVQNADDVIIFWDGESLSQVVFEAQRRTKRLQIYTVDVTKVVNRDRDAFDTYIGRGTTWGNPFRVGTQEGTFSRDEAILRYRTHFKENILSDPHTHRKLLALRGYRLGCHCKPLDCHGDILSEYLNALDPENLPDPKIATSIDQSAPVLESEITQSADGATHLFISYAIEDVELAKWLARKLASSGYAVWFDQLKLLGGEPWPQSIDLAIKNRTFRMLALMSASSIHKPNPSKERALALAIGRRRKIEDFLITLKTDSAVLDWQTNDISYISFQTSWANGLRQLLKKLSSIDAPKTLQDSAQLVISTVSQGEDLLTSQVETLRANVIRVTDIPLAIRAFVLKEELDPDELIRLSDHIPFYRVRPNYVLSFSGLDLAQASPLTATKEQWSWADVSHVHGISTRNIVSNLVVRTIQTRLIAIGCRTHPKQRGVFYLPAEFTSDGLLRYTDYKGKRTWLKIRGTASFVRPGKPRERNFHHFAFRLTIGRGLDEHFWVEIVPTLFFFDANGEPIVDERVGPRRRRLTKSWWNNKWLGRLQATEAILGSLDDSSGLSLRDGLLRLSSPVSILESALEAAPPAELDDEEVLVTAGDSAEDEELDAIPAESVESENG